MVRAKCQEFLWVLNGQDCSKANLGPCRAYGSLLCVVGALTRRKQPYMVRYRERTSGCFPLSPYAYCNYFIVQESLNTQWFKITSIWKSSLVISQCQGTQCWSSRPHVLVVPTVVLRFLSEDSWSACSSLSAKNHGAHSSSRYHNANDKSLSLSLSERVLQRSPVWPGTHNPYASAS
jgi:hypothetical protein